MVVHLKNTTVECTLDLLFDPVSFAKLHTLAALAAAGLHGEMQLQAGAATRHQLGQAGRILPEKGLSKQNILPGQYPPGVFPRPPSLTRLDKLPSQRVSWMAGLLPYMGQDAVYNKINFNQSWRHPSNWGPASTFVPQFLDRSYPASTFYTAHAEVPLDLAATHYVGIAGVGLDAGDYSSDDPAVHTKRGVLSYEHGAGLNEVKVGRGLSNAILMIQVPHDGLVGVTPWIAGGGATLRGVPEKNSIAPFVAAHGGKRGTHALMSDGSVRFIDQNVPDDVFQAMCTVNGPPPPKFDASVGQFAPVVPK